MDHLSFHSHSRTGSCISNSDIFCNFFFWGRVGHCCYCTYAVVYLNEFMMTLNQSCLAVTDLFIFSHSKSFKWSLSQCGLVIVDLIVDHYCLSRFSIQYFCWFLWSYFHHSITKYTSRITVDVCYHQLLVIY